MVIDKRLLTPRLRVRNLQNSLHAKAKAEPNYRFYSLWDKVLRKDILVEAYLRCRHNRGSHGVDHESFAKIKTYGEKRWLRELKKELYNGKYQPQPLRRVWIPKGGNSKKLRPLSIACIRDRVIQMAVLLVITPIFEADLLPEQYGFRAGVDAKMAIRRLYYHVKDYNRTELVDADLKDYFTTIPHKPLLRCISRRVSDGRILELIKQWLEVPAEEQTRRGKVKRDNLAKKEHKGVPQGSPLSPLLSNCYFRRFLLAWKQFGIEKSLNARVVNYADDFVICCKPHTANKAMEIMQNIMKRIGLEVNTEKTKIVKLPKEEIDFLGYTLGCQYNKNGDVYIGTKPSKKALQKVIRRIHDETASKYTWKSEKGKTQELNSIIRGWCGYFNQGPVIKSYDILRKYTERRLRRWLCKKHKRRGTTGYRQYPDPYLYENIGLYKFAAKMADVPKAKV